MKAAFIGGEFHGATQEIPITTDTIYYPKYWMTNFELCQAPVRVRTAGEAYWLIQCYTIHSAETIEMVILPHSLTMIANRADIMLRASALNSVVRILGVAVGLNRWLDAERKPVYATTPICSAACSPRACRTNSQSQKS